MPEDISYQPKVNEFSFSTKTPPRNPKEILNTFFTLVIAVFVFLFLFLLVLGILNYFNFISLSKYFPTVTTKLPRITPIPSPIFDLESKTYGLEATLIGFDNYLIKVKYYTQTIIFTFSPGVSKLFIQTAPQIKDVDFSETPHVLGFLSDLEQEKNISKKVYVTYEKSGNENIIKTITLIK